VTILVVPTVRPAHPDDAEALAGLHIRGWQHAYARLMPAAYLAGLDGQLEQRIVRRRQQILRPIARTACFVAVEPETSRVIGFFNAEPYRIAQNGSDLSDSVGEVYAIYVEPDRISTGGRPGADGRRGRVARRAGSRPDPPMGSRGEPARAVLLRAVRVSP
jgi:hypothetical protein